MITDSQRELDSITAATEWLKAQTINRGGSTPLRSTYSLKHVIERWYGNYVSSDAVTEAARQLGLPGEDQGFGLPKKYVFPHFSRLDGLRGALSFSGTTLWSSQGHPIDWQQIESEYETAERERDEIRFDSCADQKLLRAGVIAWYGEYCGKRERRHV